MCCEDLKCNVSAQRAMAKLIMVEIRLEQITDRQAKTDRQTGRNENGEYKKSTVERASSLSTPLSAPLSATC
jgi:hypothetical protein